jgi:23S rRNA (cytidine1920-2'-O)/16S rRNA (cytidine1409-2'-O)-methyltransferase
MNVHRDVLEEILNWASENDLAPQSLIRSPIKGAGGNIEFLVHLRRGADGIASIDEAVAAVLS